MKLHSSFSCFLSGSLLLSAFGALLTVASPVKAESFPTSGPMTDVFISHVLAIHNGVRAASGVGPLTWDPLLADGAADYAVQMSQSGIFEHSVRANRPNVGENLSMGPRGIYSSDILVSLWLEEGHNFEPGIFPDVSRTGNWMDIAHFSQVMWRGTTRIGCAVRSSSSNDYLVCRYSPKGNVDKHPVF